MFTALVTIMLTSSWGEVTMIIPSTGRDWNTVSGTSPVPGGISTNIKSISCQSVSLQNCFTAPAITGPLQITGSVSLSSSRLADMMSTPSKDLAGSIRLPSGDTPMPLSL